MSVSVDREAKLGRLAVRVAQKMNLRFMSDAEPEPTARLSGRQLVNASQTISQIVNKDKNIRRPVARITSFGDRN